MLTTAGWSTIASTNPSSASSLGSEAMPSTAGSSTSLALETSLVRSGRSASRTFDDTEQRPMRPSTCTGSSREMLDLFLSGVGSLPCGDQRLAGTGPFRCLCRERGLPGLSPTRSTKPTSRRQWAEAADKSALTPFPQGFRQPPSSTHPRAFCTGFIETARDSTWPSKARARPRIRRRFAAAGASNTTSGREPPRGVTSSRGRVTGSSRPSPTTPAAGSGTWRRAMSRTRAWTYRGRSTESAWNATPAGFNTSRAPRTSIVEPLFSRAPSDASDATGLEPRTSTG